MSGAVAFGVGIVAFLALDVPAAVFFANAALGMFPPADMFHLSARARVLNAVAGVVLVSAFFGLLTWLLAVAS